MAELAPLELLKKYINYSNFQTLELQDDVELSIGAIVNGNKLGSYFTIVNYKTDYCECTDNLSRAIALYLEQLHLNQ